MKFDEIIDIMLNRLRITSQLLELAEQQEKNRERDTCRDRADEDAAEDNGGHIDQSLSEG